MATIGNDNLTLLEIARLNGKNGEGEVVEMLSRLSPILADAVWVACNKGSTHLTSIRTGLPTGTWGRLYQGIAQSKSLTQQVEDTTGFFEMLSSVDKRLLDLAKNPAKVRLSEGKAFLEGLAHEINSGVFYHNTATTPEKFKGLAARYDSLANSHVVNAGGNGSDNTSVYFVTWGEDYTHFIHPDTVPAGIHREDKGEQRVTDASGNPYFVKEEMFSIHAGLSVRDHRYNVRIANIDVSNLKAGTVKMYDFMRQGYYKLQSTWVPGGKQVIYMNRDVAEALDALATNAGSSDNFVRLGRKEVEGQEVLTYRGIPIHVADALLNTEAALT